MDRDRAQTSPLAIALLLGLVIAGALTVVVFGSGLVDDLSNSAEEERASQEMTHFASESSAVALGGSQQRHVKFDASDGKLALDPKGSWICVQNGTLSDRQFILPEDGAPDDTCSGTHYYMGTLGYDTGEGTVAYEGGGVFRHDGEGDSRLISPPEFHYTGETLTLPVIQMDGEVATKGKTVELTATEGDTERVEVDNPLVDASGRVFVTVGSEYYEAWGAFIAERTAGQVVEIDHANETVIVELVVPQPPTVQHAIYGSGGRNQTIDLDSARVDSYNSKTPPHKYSKPEHNRSNGDVVSNGGINIGKSVWGNVYSVRKGGVIKVDDGGWVHGNIHGQRNVALNSGGSVNGSIYAEGKVRVKSNSLVEGEVHTEDMFVMQAAHVEGDVYADDDVIIDDDGVTDSVSGELHTDGDATIGAGTFQGPFHVNGTLDTDLATYKDDVHVVGSLLSDEAIYEQDVYVDGDVENLDGGVVEGDVHVTGDADISQMTIKGDVYVGGELNCQSNVITGTVHASNVDEACVHTTDTSDLETADAPDAPAGTKEPVEPLLDPPKVELPDEEEFSEVPDACHSSGDRSNAAIDIDSRTCTLEPGKYNVSRLVIDGDSPEKVNLDIATDDGGTVELYVGGQFSLSQGATIETGDPSEQNASELEINLYREGSDTPSINSNVTGVITAPGMDFDVSSGSHVFGAVLAEWVTVSDDGGVHYDEGLSGRTVADGQGDTPTIRYLQVTKNGMTVED